MTRSHSFALAVLVGVALALNPAASQGQTHFQGKIGPGSTYEIDVPAAWNGALVLYAHGLITTDQPLVPPSQLPEHNLVRNALLAGGFAVAASSYSSNGWALADAVRRTHQLSGIFAEKVDTPRRTFLMGASMGALVAVKLAETHPDQYDGALAMCGPIGGALPQVQYVGDARVLFDYYFPGVLPPTPFSVPPGTSFLSPLEPNGPSPLFLQVVNAMAADTAATIQWASAANIPANDGTELANSALFVIGSSLRATNDLIERVNGKLPYDNEGVQYVVDATSDPAINAQLSLLLNRNVDRYDADRAALNYYERNYTPSGKIGIPVVTLSTTRDPWIPAFHEAMFASAVAGAGRSELLVQRTIDRWGHCSFTVPEAQAAFGSLVQWVETGVKP
jgi:pimeloyl-ACP methyl ester carboxylesterase